MASVRQHSGHSIAQGLSGHPARRDNHSVSSTHSASSRGEREGRRRGNPAVESAVTRLLVSIKQLLEALSLWSTQQMTETQVSDVYVALGNDFNAAVAAFTSFHIEMTELMSVPEDLRTVLETCLAEDATPENLDTYLPQVRAIITNLLQGLRGKQSLYRRIMQEHKHKSESSEQGHERSDSRSSRSERLSHREGQGVRVHHSRSLPNGEVERRDETARRSATASSRRKQTTSTLSQPPATADSDESFVGGFVSPGQQLPPDDEVPNQPERASVPVQPTPHRRAQATTNSYPPSSAASSVNGRPKPPEPQPLEPQPLEPQPPEVPSPEERPETPTVQPSAQAPAHMKRYSLVDKPMAPPPAVVVEEVATPSPLEDVQMSQRQATGTPPLDSPPPEQTPAVARSLAALQKSDALERRASKRYSSYNISKMTGSKDRYALGNAGNRRSMAVGSALTPGELAVLTEEGEEGASIAPSQGSFRRKSRMYRGPPRSPISEEESAPPVPPLPSSSAPAPEPLAPTAEDEAYAEADTAAEKEEGLSGSKSFPVFLQLGREVKKVTIEPAGLSFSYLRVLFLDKFSYNPGLENFPAIYIRDPSSGVQYELEDVEEVKEKCLLSLNIEPLDQIKQHIDVQISTLSQDIKDIRSLVSSNRRISHPPPMIIGQPLGESSPPPARPTDKQFQHVARRLSRLVSHDDHTLTPDSVQPNMTGQSVLPQMTGGSIISEYSSRVVTDLKTQFDEVQNLRRDLGIMRQLYTEFMKQTKESLGTLRTQTANVRQLAAAKVGGARQYIDDGKTKLDVRSQNVLTKMEELQDLVESVKDDVLKRHITPKPQALRSVREDIDSVNTELESLKEHIKTVKPMWKKTWEEELQNIVEEQGFLNHQEEFLTDLLEDQKAVLEVYGHIEKVISLRGSNRPNSRGRLRPVNGATFTPPAPEEGHNGLTTVMLEIKNASVDPERRLKAIEASQKSREREMAKKSDEFETELKGFVKGGKLRMTGGAEEAERVRKRRDEMALKAMFSGSAPSASGSGGES
ncbi:AIP3-domain-containing protein [Neolentinus lepideus HHB14362 ss-1]|uniref:AIP3-domain-containing protein n=1 Tax=Neolentinus lepideus HHB14362 ss-1 TaxID=1314782 RepID=A0A165PKH5_9AGAM|nr:AIP3-domain-containing protein [Neolentinus lepideus HHB14362 ss-1]